MYQKNGLDVAKTSFLNQFSLNQKTILKNDADRRFYQQVLKDIKSSSYPLSAIFSVLEKVILNKKLTPGLYEKKSFSCFLDFLIKTHSIKEIHLILNEKNSYHLYQKLESDNKKKVICQMLLCGINDITLLDKAIKTESKTKSILFLLKIGQSSLIPFALSDDNDAVINNVERLIASSIPKTLASQLKARLHEICSCPDLVCLLKSSHNNRKHHVAIKLYFSGFKNHLKIKKFVNNRKKVKSFFVKVNQPVNPVKSIIENVKFSLLDKKLKTVKIKKVNLKKAKIKASKKTIKKTKPTKVKITKSKKIKLGKGHKVKFKKSFLKKIVIKVKRGKTVKGSRKIHKKGKVHHGHGVFHPLHHHKNHSHHHVHAHDEKSEHHDENHPHKRHQKHHQQHLHHEKKHHLKYHNFFKEEEKHQKELLKEGRIHFVMDHLHSH